MGGMPGCPAKPTDLASRGTFKVPLIFIPKTYWMRNMI